MFSIYMQIRNQPTLNSVKRVEKKLKREKELTVQIIFYIGTLLLDLTCCLNKVEIFSNKSPSWSHGCPTQWARCTLRSLTRTGWVPWPRRCRPCSPNRQWCGALFTTRSQIGKSEPKSLSTCSSPHTDPLQLYLNQINWIIRINKKIFFI